jgi:uncharacterized protein
VNVLVRFTKWGDQPHWRLPTEFLGDDEFGRWLVGWPGTIVQRGLEPPRPWKVGCVGLVPHDRPWISWFNATGEPEVYVDVCSVPVWLSETEVTAVDLDLDVIRRRDGTVFIDDEDEFAEHQIRFGYPPDVVDLVTTTARQLVAEVGGRTAPFDETATRWLERSGLVGG